MKFCVVIKGSSAAGKSSLALKLLARYSPSRRMTIIHGDFLSHVVFESRFRPSELKLKYRAMCALIHVIAQEKKYNLILEDSFRRAEDLTQVVQCLESAGATVLIVHLSAPLEVLRGRNRIRHPLMYMKEETLEKLLAVSERVRDAKELVINSADFTLEEIVEQVDARLRQLRKNRSRS